MKITPPRTAGACRTAPGAMPLPQGCIRREGTSEALQMRLDRRLEGVAEAVGGGYCRLQLRLTRALAVRGTAAVFFSKTLPQHMYSQLNGVWRGVVGLVLMGAPGRQAGRRIHRHPPCPFCAPCAYVACPACAPEGAAPPPFAPGPRSMGAAVYTPATCTAPVDDDDDDDGDVSDLGISDSDSDGAEDEGPWEATGSMRSEAPSSAERLPGQTGGDLSGSEGRESDIPRLFAPVPPRSPGSSVSKCASGALWRAVPPGGVRRLGRARAVSGRARAVSRVGALCRAVLRHIAPCLM